MTEMCASLNNAPYEKNAPYENVKMTGFSSENDCSAKLAAGGVPVWFEDGIAQIDVRGLEPPRPMVAIVELIEWAGAGDAVVVRLDRDPIHLYPELVERGWSWTKIPSPPDQVRLRLTRNKPEAQA